MNKKKVEMMRYKKWEYLNKIKFDYKKIIKEIKYKKYAW